MTPYAARLQTILLPRLFFSWPVISTKAFLSLLTGKDLKFALHHIISDSQLFQVKLKCTSRAFDVVTEAAAATAAAAAADDDDDDVLVYFPTSGVTQLRVRGVRNSGRG